MKIKPMDIIDNSHQLEVAYQEDETCYVNQIINNIQVKTLHDVIVGFEELEIYVNLVGQFINNEEENEEEEDKKKEDI